MTRKEEIEHLQAARNLLDQSYCKWTWDDGKGGHCAVGCLIMTDNERLAGMGWSFLKNLLDEEAEILHPELKDAVRERPGGMYDCFNTSPTVYVNNQLGKETTLQLFDAVILALEIAEESETYPQGGGSQIEESREKEPVSC